MIRRREIRSVAAATAAASAASAASEQQSSTLRLRVFGGPGNSTSFGFIRKADSHATVYSDEQNKCILAWRTELADSENANGNKFAPALPFLLSITLLLFSTTCLYFLIQIEEEPTPFR